MSINKYPNNPETYKCLKLYMDSPNDIIMKRKKLYYFCYFSKRILKIGSIQIIIVDSVIVKYNTITIQI